MSRKPRGTKGSGGQGIQGGGGGWAVPPPLRSLHQRRRSMGWSLSRVLWALCRRSPWRALVASGGSKPPAGDTVRTGGGRSCTVRVHCGGQPVLPYRFGRPGRRLGPAAVAANSLPVPFSARGNRRGARSGGERDATRPPYPRRSRGVPLPPGTCRAARGGCLRAPCPFPAPSRLPPLRRRGGGGDRRDRRVAAVGAGGSARACTLRRAALSCADRELAQAVPNIETLFFQCVTVS